MIAPEKLRAAKGVVSKQAQAYAGPLQAVMDEVQGLMDQRPNITLAELKAEVAPQLYDVLVASSSSEALLNKVAAAVSGFATTDQDPALSALCRTFADVLVESATAIANGEVGLTSITENRYLKDDPTRVWLHQRYMHNEPAWYTKLEGSTCGVAASYMAVATAARRSDAFAQRLAQYAGSSDPVDWAAKTMPLFKTTPKGTDGGIATQVLQDSGLFKSVEFADLRAMDKEKGRPAVVEYVTEQLRGGRYIMAAAHYGMLRQLDAETVDPTQATTAFDRSLLEMEKTKLKNNKTAMGHWFTLDPAGFRDDPQGPTVVRLDSDVPIEAGSAGDGFQLHDYDRYAANEHSVAKLVEAMMGNPNGAKMIVLEPNTDPV